MDLTHLTQPLYPRAVTASAEGRMRPPGSETDPPNRPQARYASNASILRESRAPDAALQQYRAEQNSQWSNSGPARELSAYGEQMAVASRRARQTHSRRSDAMPALISTRGREANRRYLETSMASQPRLIDEVI